MAFMLDEEMPRRLLIPHTTKATTNRYNDLLGEHMENFTMETSALHRKLQSKVEALRILRKELEKFRTERDQFKLMAETLQLRYSAITQKRSGDLGASGFDGNKSSVATILHESRERNIRLTTEVEALKQKLNELQGDMQLLRAKESTRIERCGRVKSVMPAIEANAKDELQWKQERTNFISHLENLKKKNAQLAFDFKAIIDEKEELITERDAYKCKAHRLNHELFIALKANETHPKFLDIDSIILENKYLHERLKNFENELDLTKQSMNKYKTMLETKRKKGIIKLGTSSNDESILSHKQVKNILESGIDLPTKTETIQDLKSLCLALLDNLNDKNLALSHQKKTNKILTTKIAELEERIQTLLGVDDDGDSTCNSGYSPSQILLHGYCPSLVDSSNTNGTTTTTTTNTGTKANGTIPKFSYNIADESSGTMSSEHEHDVPRKISRANSDDNESSLSTGSGRSVSALSSEYGMDIGAACSLSEFTNAAMYAYKTPSTTTDSGNYLFKTSSLSAVTATTTPNSSRISSSIAKERMDDLKDLPPELAAMVQKALHELDLRDFDEVVGACEGVGEEALEEQHLNDSKDEEEEQEEQENYENLEDNIEEEIESDDEHKNYADDDDDDNTIH